MNLTKVVLAIVSQTWSIMNYLFKYREVLEMSSLHNSINNNNTESSCGQANTASAHMNLLSLTFTFPASPTTSLLINITSSLSPLSYLKKIRELLNFLPSEVLVEEQSP